MLVLAGTDQDVRILCDRRIFEIRDRHRTCPGTLRRSHGVHRIFRLAGIRNPHSHIPLSQLSRRDLL